MRRKAKKRDGVGNYHVITHPMPKEMGCADGEKNHRCLMQESPAVWKLHACLKLLGKRGGGETLEKHLHLETTSVRSFGKKEISSLGVLNVHTEVLSPISTFCYVVAQQNTLFRRSTTAVLCLTWSSCPSLWSYKRRIPCAQNREELQPAKEVSNWLKWPFHAEITPCIVSIYEFSINFAPSVHP